MARESFFQRLKEGLEEGIAHEKGETKLKVTHRQIPQPPRPYGSKEIKEIRHHLEMSQAEFSKFLFVSQKTVEGWEQGLRKPTGSAARLIQIIENPHILDVIDVKAPGTMPAGVAKTKRARNRKLDPSFGHSVEAGPTEKSLGKGARKNPS